MRRRGGFLQFLIALEAIVLIALVGVGYMLGGPKLPVESVKVEASEENNFTDIDPMADTLEGAVGSMETEPVSRPEEFSQEVTDFAAAMSTEQKIAQLIITTPEILTKTNRVSSAGNITQKAINKYQVGGLIYSPNNYESSNQINVLLGKTNNMYGEITNTNLVFFANVGTTDSPVYVYAKRFDVVGYSSLLNGEFSMDKLDTESFGTIKTFVNGYGDAHMDDPYILVRGAAAAQKLTANGYGGVIIGYGGDYSELIGAGCDAVIVDDDIDTAISTLSEGLASGAFDETRLNYAVEYILTAKSKLADTGLQAITTKIITTSKTPNANTSTTNKNTTTTNTNTTTSKKTQEQINKENAANLAQQQAAAAAAAQQAAEAEAARQAAAAQQAAEAEAARQAAEAAAAAAQQPADQGGAGNAGGGDGGGEPAPEG